MLKHIGLSVLILAMGLSSWGQEAALESPSAVPNEVRPTAISERNDPFQPVVPEDQQQYRKATQQYWYAQKEASEDELSPVVPPFIVTDAEPAVPEVLKVVTRRLDVPIPMHLLTMLRPLLGPGGQYEYDEDLRLVVLSGSEEGIKAAYGLIETLCEAYGEAMEEEARKEEEARDEKRAFMEEETRRSQPQAVQIEAVLLLGRKAADRVVSSTETGPPYALPAEIAELGLGEVDLLPFAFGEVEVVGRTILHSSLAPFQMGGRQQVQADLAGHRIEFVLQHIAPDYPVLHVSVEHEVPASAAEGPASMGVMGMGGASNASRIASVEGAASAGAPQAGFGEAAGGVGPRGGGRKSVGRGAARGRSSSSGPSIVRNSHLTLPGQTQRKIVGMTSEPKVVFDRPILVGSYTNPEETAILAIRLTRIED